MSETAIFLVGLFVSALCFFFVVATFYEVRRIHGSPTSSPEPTEKEELAKRK